MGHTFAVDNEKNLITPAANVYTLKNNSSVPVYVSKIEVTPESGVKLVGNATASDDVLVSLAMQTNKASASKVTLKADDGGTSPVTQSYTAADWQMAANGDSAASDTLQITFSNGKVNKVDANWVKEKTKDDIGQTDGTKLFTIQYTVTAGNAPTVG